MPARKPFHHGALATALKDAAVAIVSADGVEALTLRAVATRAGTTHPSLYRHYRSKEGLLAAIAEDGFRRLSEALDEAVAAERAPLDKFHAIGVAHVRFALKNRVHFRLMYGPE